MEAFMRALEGIRTPFLDKLFLIITEAGGETFFLGLLCILYWCVNKKLTYRMGFTYFFSGLTVQSLKVMCRVPRPWIKYKNFTAVEAAYEGASGYSFPSGHTNSATSIFGTLFINIKKVWFKVLCVVAVLLVIFSRMYLGVHTPLDVSISFLITALIVFIIDRIAKKVELTKSSKITYACLLIIFAIISFIYTMILYKNGIIDGVDKNNVPDGGFTYVLDIAKIAGSSIGFAIAWVIETTYINFDEKKGNLLFHIFKVAFGIAVALGLKIGLKYVLDNGLGTLGQNYELLGASIRYCILVFWCMCLFPLIIKKMQK